MVNEMHKKRILFVITKSVWGGAQKYVYDLATNFPKEEFDISVACGGNGLFAERLKETGIKTFQIKNFQRDISFVSDVLAFFEVLKLLRKEKPDIIHVNSSKAGGIVGFSSLFYKLLGGATAPPQLIFTVHGWAFNEARPKWQIFLIKIASHLTCIFYDKIICVSEFDRQAAIKNKIAPEKKLITVHNGIDIDESGFLSREEAIEKLKNKNQKLKIAIQNLKLENIIIIGTVGEFTKNKGQEYLIEAVKILNSAPYTLYSKPYTLILGWGEEKSNLKFQISCPIDNHPKGENLGLENQVFLVEGLSPASSYLKAFDIFVLPSIKEGLPYTLLEAGLAGLPVIASNIGGISEIIENEKTGLLISPADSDKLVNAIKKLLEDKNLADGLAKNLRQKIILEFSLEKMVKETLKVYL